MVQITIKNSNIDSNNAVILRAANILPGYSKQNNADALWGTDQIQLPEGKVTGVLPPSFTVTGVIDVDDLDGDTELWSETPSTLSGTFADGTSKVGYVTLGYLLALWRDRVGQNILNVTIGDGTTTRSWKNYKNDSTDIYVVVDAVSPTPDQSTEGRHIINYSITMREVSPDGTFS